jgi:T6SS, Phospholipase effector Tle1-like, catalytic domain
VHTVYEHGAGYPRAEFEDEREEQARRYRVKYRTQDDVVKNERGDVVPYFIGVFDTVAALGSTGIKKALMIAVTAIILLVTAYLVSLVVSWLFHLPLWIVIGSVMIASMFAFYLYSYRVRVKVIENYPEPGERRKHWSGWRFQHYDRFLDKRVRYARHAQAIDEMRATFARVGWGRIKDFADAPDDWLVQKWFAGNHSDIGGSYAETESRLSDIALEWMAKEAEGIPNGMIFDWSKLNVFPDPAGIQHCEVTTLREYYPNWVPVSWRRSWKEQARPDISLASCHPSVLERFKLGLVSNCGIRQPYQPKCLRNEVALAEYYPQSGASIAVAAQNTPPTTGQECEGASASSA